MGNCSNKNSTQIVESSELINQNSSNNKIVPFQNIQINVFISYCWFDKSLSHSLAKELSKKGFNIFIDRDKVTLDSFISLEKSDFAIICLSNSYLKCFNCQREARLVFDQKISVIAHENESEKRKVNYDKQFSLKVEKEKNFVEREREHLKKVFVYDDFLKGLYLEVPWIYRWYNKYPKVILSNFPPFSPSGDYNDAAFQIPSDFFDYLKSDTKISNGSTGRGNNASHLISKKSTNLCLVSADYEINLLNKKKNESKYDASILDFMKSIERLSRFETNIPKGHVVWKTIDNLDFNSQPPRSEKEIMRRKLLDSDLRIKKLLRINISKYFNDKYHDCEQDQFCLFAEKMLNNIQDFEDFYKKNSLKTELII
ncbi:unnamed protein product [Brachionus calyciflorus]|uniref:TIR domain-containing protein n=1 Tax=Brachionus calyciflorus TaxID=104777 RepID=A0A813V6V5_9BILA|nr:unnamed protein product [Brachionus calyciflorus]